MSKKRDHICHRLLVLAITKMKKTDDKEFMEYWHSKENHEMCLLVDDKFKLSVRKVMEEWEKQVDSWVKKEAKKLIEQRISGIFEEVTDSIRDDLDDIETKFKSMLRKLEGKLDEID